MPFHIEAYPQGFPQLAVPVIEGSNVSAQEHARALAEATEQATQRFIDEFHEKFGGAILFACHDDEAKNYSNQQGKPARNNSVVY